MFMMKNESAGWPSKGRLFQVKLYSHVKNHDFYDDHHHAPSVYLLLSLKKKIFILLYQVSIAAFGIFGCGLQNLVP